MSTPSFQEIGRLAGSNPVHVEQLTIDTTPVYSVNVFQRGQVVRVIASVDAYVKFVREHVPNGLFGDGFHEIAQNIFTADVEDAPFDPSALWRPVIVTNQPTLNKTSPIAGARDLELNLADQDDEVRILLAHRRRLGEGLVQPFRLKAVTNHVVRVRHIESNALNSIEFQLRYTNAANTVRYFEVGVGWTSTPTWNAITGSATEVTEDFAVATEEEGVYELRLRSDGDAAETARIDQVGFIEAQGDLDGAFLNAEVEYIFALPFRARVACDGSAAGTLRIDDMRAY